MITKLIVQMIIISNLISFIHSQDFQLGLNYAALIDNNHTNIRCIGNTSNNKFVISLDNSQGRLYDYGLTSYLNFTME